MSYKKSVKSLQLESITPLIKVDWLLDQTEINRYPLHQENLIIKSVRIYYDRDFLSKSSFNERYNIPEIISTS